MTTAKDAAGNPLEVGQTVLIKARIVEITKLPLHAHNSVLTLNTVLRTASGDSTQLAVESCQVIPYDGDSKTMVTSFPLSDEGKSTDNGLLAPEQHSRTRIPVAYSTQPDTGDDVLITDDNHLIENPTTVEPVINDQEIDPETGRPFAPGNPKRGRKTKLEKELDTESKGS